MEYVVCHADIFEIYMHIYIFGWNICSSVFLLTKNVVIYSNFSKKLFFYVP